MSRTLRGAWSRRGALLTLVAMTTVVVGGAVATLRFVDEAGLSPLLTAPLLLLGAVAVPSIGAELAVARREEVGLARLRGVRGVRLWRLVLGEPALAVVLGLAAGLGLGGALGALATRRWLDEGGAFLDRTAVLWALAIALGGIVIVGLGAAAALREPLAVQVATRHRPRRATTLTVFLTVLVVVGGAVAAYRSQRLDAPDSDLLVLVGPALVGLALGQATIWLVRLVARVGTGATADRGLGAFLTTRRLARADDLVTPLRLVVAAAVVGTLALTGALAVDRWSGDQARIQAAGPLVATTDTGAAGAWQLTRRLDPKGRHLMAAALVPSERRLDERRAYVDASRWDAVVGDFLDGTPAEEVAAVVPELAVAEPPVFSGDRLTVAGTRVLGSSSSGGFGGPPASRVLAVGVGYVTPEGSSGTAVVELELPERGASDRRTTRVPGCADGCLVTSMTVGRRVEGSFVPWEDSAFEVSLDQAQVGDLDLLEQVWVPDPVAVEASRSSRWAPPDPGDPVNHALNTPDGLVVTPLPDVDLPLLLEQASADLPVLAGDPVETAYDLGSDERRAAVVAEADVLPLVGSTGTLADLSTAAVGSGPSVPSTEVRIVAGEDTPEALLAEVEAATGAQWRDLDEVRADLADAHGGAQAVAYALTALACGLVALLALAAGVARHRRAFRRDTAALRVVGVGIATARRAGRTELAVLTAVVAVAVAVGGWLAVAALLDGLPLISPPPAALPVATSPTALSLAVPALLAVLAVAVVGGRARRAAVATTRPSSLREEEGQ